MAMSPAWSATTPPPRGGDERPDATHMITCLRTGPQLTVQIAGVNGDVGNKPQQVANLVNEAWSGLAYVGVGLREAGT